MNKRQKKKIMKKYIIKSQCVKNIANVIFSRLQLHNLSVQMIMETRLNQLNIEYQNHLYGHVKNKYLFTNFGSPCTLAEIHRMSPKYDYHMKLKTSKKIINAERRLSISLLMNIQACTHTQCSGKGRCYQ